MKTKLFSALVLTSLSMVATSTVVQAASYPNETKGISDVNVSVTLGDDGGPIIPPVDPENPEPPIDPENPNKGPLAVRYVSDLDFGEIEVNTEGATVYAEKDTGIGGERFDNMVTVQDYRNVRDGWELTVAMDTDFIPGSQIKMMPYIHSSTAERSGVETPLTELILNGSAQVFARTTSNENPAAIVSMNMANPSSKGIELLVPANTATGEYSTTVTWNLVSGPMAPEA